MATAAAAPAPDGDEFARQLRKAVEAVRAKAQRVQIAFAIALFNEIQSSGRYSDGTPVANPRHWKKPVKGYVGGFARANWHLSLGTPVDSVLDPSIEGTSAAEAEIARSIQRNLDTVKGFRLGQIAYFSNNTPYIGMLEFGWSDQAPVGMVRSALRDAQPLLDEVTAHLNQGGQDGR